MTRQGLRLIPGPNAAELAARQAKRDALKADLHTHVDAILAELAKTLHEGIEENPEILAMAGPQTTFKSALKHVFGGFNAQE
jgi:hypothetical protein